MNMLQTFQLTRDSQDKDLSQLPYYQLGFGSGALPDGRRVHEVVAGNNNISLAKDNVLSSS